MGQIAKALGQGSNVTYKGQTYKVSPWKYKVLGEFEKYLEENALAKMRMMRRALEQDEYDKFVVATHRDIASGVYTFGSPETQKALNSRQHFEYLFYLCVLDNHPGLPYEFVREMVAELGIETVMEKVTEANADPTQPTSRTSTDSSGTATGETV